MVVYENGYAFIDGYKFRKDTKTGYYLSTKNIFDNRRVRLHVYVWRKINGEVPAGHHVHHVDGDRGNNDISNLRAVEGHSHVKEHGSNLTDAERARRAETAIEKAMPKARQWHGSAEGREWHIKQAKYIHENMKEKEFVCLNCGKTFSKKPLGVNKFCTNNCKSAHRKKSGIDDITKKCDDCGGEYIANKYSKTKWCEVCKNKKHKRNRKSRCI